MMETGMSQEPCMQTDIPLKRLTRIVPEDVLFLLGIPDADVLGVQTLELPSSKTSLDTVIRVRQLDGHDYLHLIEWQGWHDPTFLWRVLGYLSWLGQNHTERPILATLVYLKPADDVGDTLIQQLAGMAGWQVHIPCVRLWQQDAVAAVASGRPGLMALAPLMQGASPALVEQVAQQLISSVAAPIQAELLAALGIFAEPLVDAERFIRLVTKERLMSSDLITLLTADLVEEKDALLQEKRALLHEKDALLHEKDLLLQERALLAQQVQERLRQAIEDILVTRFPTAPLRITTQLRNVVTPDQLQSLIHVAAIAPDINSIEQAITTAQMP
jgi:hypothetical protein